MSNEKKLIELELKEYVNCVLLREYDEMGINFGSAELYDTFIKPFANVGKVAAGEIKKTGRRVATAAHVFIKATLVTILPIFKSDYDKIWNKHSSKIQETQNEYREAYDSVFKVFDHQDVVAAAFMYAPLQLFTNKTIQKAPQAFMNILEKLSDHGDKLHSYFEKVDQKYGASTKSRGRGGYDPYSFFGESTLHEDSNEHQGKRSIVDVLTQKKLISTVTNSSKFKKFVASGRAEVQRELAEIFDHVKKLMNVRSIEDLQRVTKTTLKGQDKLGNDDQNTKEETLKQVKKATKNFYVGMLKKQVEQATKSGVPSSSPYIEVHGDVIKKIQGL